MFAKPFALVVAIMVNEKGLAPVLKYDITDCFNKNKIQTAVTNMMKQRMLQKTKILKT